MNGNIISLSMYYVMIVTTIGNLPVISIEKTYTTNKTIKYNIYDGSTKKILYVSPDFTHVTVTEGIMCTKYINKSIALELNEKSDRDFIILLEEITNRINLLLKSSKFTPVPNDKGLISKWVDKDGSSRIYIWCDIIQTTEKDNNTKIFTRVYDTSATTFDITKLNTRAIVRPSLCFRLSYNISEKVFRLRASISEMCIINVLPERRFNMLPSTINDNNRQVF